MLIVYYLNLRVDDIDVHAEARGMLVWIDIESAKLEAVTMRDSCETPWGAVLNIYLLSRRRITFNSRDSGRGDIRIIDPDFGVAFDIFHFRKGPDERDQGLGDMDGISLEVFAPSIKIRKAQVMMILLGREEGGWDQLLQVKMVFDTLVEIPQSKWLALEALLVIFKPELLYDALVFPDVPVEETSLQDNNIAILDEVISRWAASLDCQLRKRTTHWGRRRSDQGCVEAVVIITDGLGERRARQRNSRKTNKTGTHDDSTQIRSCDRCDGDG